MWCAIGNIASVCMHRPAVLCCVWLRPHPAGATTRTQPFGRAAACSGRGTGCLPAWLRPCCTACRELFLPGCPCTPACTQRACMHATSAYSLQGGRTRQKTLPFTTLPLTCQSSSTAPPGCPRRAEAGPPPMCWELGPRPRRRPCCPHLLGTRAPLPGSAGSTSAVQRNRGLPKEKRRCAEASGRHRHWALRVASLGGHAGQLTSDQCHGGLSSGGCGGRGAWAWGLDCRGRGMWQGMWGVCPWQGGDVDGARPLRCPLAIWEPAGAAGGHVRTCTVHRLHALIDRVAVKRAWWHDHAASKLQLGAQAHGCRSAYCTILSYAHRPRSHSYVRSNSVYVYVHVRSACVLAATAALALGCACLPYPAWGGQGPTAFLMKATEASPEPMHCTGRPKGIGAKVGLGS